MNNGCPKCEGLLKVDEMCIDCQIEFADYNVNWWMKRLEELKEKKEKKNGTISKD